MEKIYREHLRIDPIYREEIRNIEELEDLLFNRKNKERTNYGIYENDQTVVKVSLFEGGSESLLADIYNKNKDEDMGNIKVPGTEIELVNYTVCPECKSTFSFQETQRYFTNPVLNPKKNKFFQMRRDTRFRCSNCNTFFLPALIMVDNTKPQSEFQFLCRLQTVEAVESFYMSSYQQKVLTKKINYKYHLKNKICVLNDVNIFEMKAVPTLISNMIQYTPYDLILNFINGEHYKKDPLFGYWKNSN